MKLLVLHQGAIGDFMLAIPAIWNAYLALKPIELHLVGHPWALQVLEGVYWVNRIWDINLYPFSTLWVEPLGLNFQMALVFSKAPEWPKAFKDSGIKEIWVFPPFPQERTPLFHHHLKTLKSYGISLKTGYSGLFLKEEEKEEALGFLENKGIKGAFFAVHPGAGSSKKIWPPERMAHMVNWVYQESGFFPLIIKGPADKEACEEFLKYLKAPHHLIENLHLRKLGALLSFASFFLGNDSGIAHLAAFSKCLTFVLFGPSDPIVFMPYGPYVKCLKKGEKVEDIKEEDLKELLKNHLLLIKRS
jgi:ADP-heptose:LPS heptosyltransferase